MLNKSTSRGTLADRPLPYANGIYGTYYFCIDNSTYYYSDGEKWVAKPIDTTDLPPETESQIICGISDDGSINPIRLDSTGGLKISGSVSGGGGGGGNGLFIKRSGAIAVGNTSQQITAANTARKYLLIQNISDTDMYLGIGETATTSGLLVPKNGGCLGWDAFVPTNAVNVICTIATKKFVAFEA